MNPYAIIGAGLALMSMISTIGYLAYSWKVQIETTYAHKLEAGLARQAKAFQETTAKATLSIADNQHEKDLSALNNKHESTIRIRELNYKLERISHDQPFKASNLYEYNVRRLMCLISQGGDTTGRKSCNRFEAATEDYSPDVASFITVTRETTDYWNEQCDKGLTDFCNYAIMGFTQQGASDLLADLNEIDYYQLRLSYGEDARIEALKYLRDINTKNIANKKPRD